MTRYWYSETQATRTLQYRDSLNRIQITVGGILTQVPYTECHKDDFDGTPGYWPNVKDAVLVLLDSRPGYEAIKHIGRELKPIAEFDYYDW